MSKERAVRVIAGLCAWGLLVAGLLLFVLAVKVLYLALIGHAIGGGALFLKAAKLLGFGSIWVSPLSLIALFKGADAFGKRLGDRWVQRLAAMELSELGSAFPVASPS